jgi:hypothetical protein
MNVFKSLKLLENVVCELLGDNLVLSENACFGLEEWTLSTNNRSAILSDVFRYFYNRSSGRFNKRGHFVRLNNKIVRLEDLTDSDLVKVANKVLK